MTNSIDEKNKQLLEELQSAGVQIDFVVNPDFKSWAVQQRPKYLIVANNEDSNPESLAHELLHIKMNILGFISSYNIVDIFNPHNTHFATQEFGTLENLLSHIRMLSLFVGMGYSVEKFLSNYGNDFLVYQLFPTLAKVQGTCDFNRNENLKPSIDVITDFLKLVICLKFSEVENSFLQKKVDTSVLKKELQDIDSDLFENLYEELTAWVNSGDNKNYQLYMNLNIRLAKLGYPTEADWSSWKYAK